VCTDTCLIIAQFSVTFGTLTLAYFAWRAIRETRDSQERIKREAQLKEVAEWATAAMIAFSDSEIQLFPSEWAGFEEVSKEEYIKKRREVAYANVVLKLEIVDSRGEYIKIIAEHLDIEELPSKLEHTKNLVVKLINDIMGNKYSEIKKELRESLFESAKQVIALATKADK